MMGAVVIYGANFPLSRLATQQGLSPADLVALRYAIGGAVLLPVFLRAGAATCAGVGWGRGIALAIMSGAPMALLMNTGLKFAPAGHGAALAPGTVTVVGIVGSYLLFRVRPSAYALAGVTVVLGGLACIAAAGTASGPTVLLGDLLFVLNGLLWGFYPLLLQRWQVGGMVSTSIVSVLSLPYIPLYVAFLHPGLMQVDPWIVAFHAVNQGSSTSSSASGSGRPPCGCSEPRGRSAFRRSSRCLARSWRFPSSAKSLDPCRRSG